MADMLCLSLSRCHCIILKHILVVTFLITYAASQRRWAGSYPTEPPLEIDYDKPSYQDKVGQRPENPHYIFSGTENEKDEADKEETGKHDFIQPEYIDARRHDERRDPKVEIDRKDRFPSTSDQAKGIERNPHRDRSDSEVRNSKRQVFPISNPKEEENPSRDGRVVVVVSRIAPKETASEGRNDKNYPDVRIEDFPHIEPKRGDEDSSKDRKLVISQISPKVIESGNGNNRENPYPSVETKRREENLPRDGRVEVISQPLPKEASDSRSNPGSRKVSLSNVEHRNRGRIPTRDESSLVVAQGSKQSPTSGENTRTFPNSRKNFPNFESERKDERDFISAQNTSKESTFRGRSVGRDFPEYQNRRIRNEDGKQTSVNSRDNPRNYNRGSNENDRVESKPKLQHPTTRTYSIPSFQGSTRKEEKSNTEPHNREERDRRHGISSYPKSSLDDLSSDNCEHTKKTSGNKPSPSPRNPVRLDSTKILKSVPEIKASQTETPRVIVGSNVDGRKVIIDDKNEEKFGFHPDVSYDAILFPTDDDYGRYRQATLSTTRNQRRSRIRSKRDVDLHEDVEILPGYGISAIQKQVLRNNNDEIIEGEIEIFSMKEIKIKKSS